MIGNVRVCSVLHKGGPGDTKGKEIAVLQRKGEGLRNGKRRRRTREIYNGTSGSLYRNSKTSAKGSARQAQRNQRKLVGPLVRDDSLVRLHDHKGRKTPEQRLNVLSASKKTMVNSSCCRKKRELKQKFKAKVQKRSFLRFTAETVNRSGTRGSFSMGKRRRYRQSGKTVQAKPLRPGEQSVCLPARRR